MIAKKQGQDTTAFEHHINFVDSQTPKKIISSRK